VVRDGAFGEVTELRFSTWVGLKTGGRRRAPHHVKTDLDGGVDDERFGEVFVFEASSAQHGASASAIGTVG
jgi:hypothetical protein